MHTTEGVKYRFHHNRNLSGDVLVVDKQSEDLVAKIPGDDLKTLIATWIRHERIVAIEDASNNETLFDVSEHRIAL